MMCNSYVFVAAPWTAFSAEALDVAGERSERHNCLVGYVDLDAAESFGDDGADDDDGGVAGASVGGWAGALDEAALFGVALDAAAVRALYERQAARWPSAAPSAAPTSLGDGGVDLLSGGAKNASAAAAGWPCRAALGGEWYGFVAPAVCPVAALVEEACGRWRWW